MKDIALKCLEVGFPPYLVSVPNMGTMHAEPGEIAPEHKHQVVEVHYIIEGTMKLVLGKREYDVRKNHLFITRPGDTHYQYFISRSKIFYIQLAIAKWDWRHAMTVTDPGKKIPARTRSGPGANARDPILSILNSSSRLLEANSAVRKCIINDLPLLMKNPNSGSKASLKRFCLSVSKLIEGKKEPEIKRRGPGLELLKGKVREKIREAKRHLDLHFDSSGSMDVLAKNACLSQKHFERLFRKATGFSPSQYVMEKRLQMALQLLKQRELKIESIMSMSGFKNRGHFFRAFYQRTGSSPDQFRKNILANRHDPFRAI